MQTDPQILKLPFQHNSDDFHTDQWEHSSLDPLWWLCQDKQEGFYVQIYLDAEVLLLSLLIQIKKYLN